MPHRSDHRGVAAANAELQAELRQLRREVERLRLENEVLREAAEPLIHHAAAHERFAFTHRLRDRFTLKRLCQILVTDRSNYYLWTRAQARSDEHNRQEQQPTELITEIHTARPAYGAERITRELKRQGHQVGRRGVARLMREHGVAGITRRKHRSLTKPNTDAAPPASRLR